MNPPTSAAVSTRYRDELPERLRLAPGRAVLWRSATCLQLGVEPHRAMVLDALPEPLAALLRRMDGVRRTSDLLAEAEAAGAASGSGQLMLAELHRAGLVQDAAPTEGGPTGWHRIALAAEAAQWSVRTTQSPRDVLRRRREAVVHVAGSGRVAAALTAALAAGGVGQVTVHATGAVSASDLGTGLLPDDLGRPRAAAMADAALRAAPQVRVSACRPPDLVVLTDVVVPEPAVVSGLLADRVPHLLAYAHEGAAAVGPLVWPGRSSCLRCAELHRADLDKTWPKLAAQLVGRTAASDLATTLLAAALAAEQAFAALAGPGAGRPVPATWGATLELDPVGASLRRRPRPPHPRCHCGAR